ncbi:MAG: CopG family antitoxin [Spirochaetota bacterium]
MTKKLKKYERDILKSFEKGQWQEVSEIKKEKKNHLSYAKAAIKKDKRINIRISQNDLESLQKIAMEEGIPYQTMISSVLHKYVNGKLVEVKKRP